MTFWYSRRLTFVTSSCTLSCTGVLEVLQCVLVESPEALNAIKEGHIHSIISFLDKHGCNHKVVFASICFCVEMKIMKCRGMTYCHHVSVFVGWNAVADPNVCL